MISKIRWKNYLKVQKSGKRNMYGYDMEIQNNYDEVYKHFEENKKEENWELKEVKK